MNHFEQMNSSVPLNLSLELLREVVIVPSPPITPFPPVNPIERLVSESCLLSVWDLWCVCELYCPRLSKDLFSVTVGKSALGYEARFGFCDAFIDPFDLRSRNLIFPPELLVAAFTPEDLLEANDFPMHDRLFCETCLLLIVSRFSVSGIEESLPSPPDESSFDLIGEKPKI